MFCPTGRDDERVWTVQCALLFIDRDEDGVGEEDGGPGICLRNLCQIYNPFKESVRS